MLVKLLSKNNFLVQTILLLAFLVLISIGNRVFEFDAEAYLSLGIFIITIVLSLFYFNRSILFELGGYPLWFFLLWVIPFSGTASDLRLCAIYLLTTFVFFRLLKTDVSLEHRLDAFNIGMLLCITTLIYPPAIFLFLFVGLYFLYAELYQPRLLLLLFMGFVIPLFIVLQVLFITDNLIWIEYYINELNINILDYSGDLLFLIPIFAFLILCWIDHFLSLRKQDLKKKHIYLLILFYFFNWLGIIFFFGGNTYELLIMLGLPISVFATKFTRHLKKAWMQEIMLWLYFAFVLLFIFNEEVSYFFNWLLGGITF